MNRAHYSSMAELTREELSGLGGPSLEEQAQGTRHDRNPLLFDDQAEEIEPRAVRPRRKRRA